MKELLIRRSCPEKRPPNPPPPQTHTYTHITPSPPPLLEQEVMDHTFEKLYGSIEQTRFMLCLALLTSKTMYVRVCVCMCLNVCPCLLCARPSVVMMHIFREVASCAPPALKPRRAN